MNAELLLKITLTKPQLGMLVSVSFCMALAMAVGFIYAKKTRDVGEFYLAGRQLSPFVTAMSAECSDMSAWLFLVLPAMAYASGVANAGWTAISIVIGTYFNWLITARRLRNYSAHIDTITVPDFLSERYREKRKTLSLLSVLVMIVFYIPYIASSFAACGKLFSVLFGSDYRYAMLASGLAILAYTLIGGFNAVSNTHCVQAAIILIALVIALLFGVQQAGGFEAVKANAAALPGYLGLRDIYDSASGASADYKFINSSGEDIDILSKVPWILGYIGMPHILVRFMAIENPRRLATSRRLGTGFAAIIMTLAIFVGIAFNGMVNSSQVVGALEDNQTIFISLATLMAENSMFFALVAGVIVSGIVATAMSSADSQLLAASSAISENVIGNAFKIKDATGKKTMLIARLTLVVICLLAIAVAWDSNSKVLDILVFAWAGFGASLGPTMLLALFWKRSNKYGAVFGMVAGAASVFIWDLIVAPMLGDNFEQYALIPAFLCGLLVNLVVSLITKKPDDEIMMEFEQVQDMSRAS